MKKGKDQYTQYLFMAGVVAIVAIVALVLSNGSGNLEGATFAKETADQVNDGCSDDDPDNDFFVAGTVKHGKFLYQDHCQDGQLHQHYCKNNKDVSHTKHYDCPNGCLDGACLR